MELLEIACSSLVLSIVNIYIWNKLLKEKIKVLSIKNFVSILLLSVAIMLNYIFNNAFFRVVCITMIFSLYIKRIYRKTYTKSLCIAVFGQIIFMISDLFFALITFPFSSGDINKIKEIYFSKFYSNVGVALISIIVINIPKIKNIFKKIVELIVIVRKKQIIFLLIALLFSINLLLGLIYYQINMTLIVLIIGILLLIYTYITLQSITQQEHIANIRVEYDSLMDKAVEYEQILNENRRDLHELKNDFSVLKVLIEKSKKDALKHLDFMFKEYGKVESGLTGNSKCYNKTLRVPSGGLRGLLSTKLKLMEDMKIDYNLRISKDINAKIFKSTKSDYVRQIGKLLGIYLDNAINAVSKLNEKNINVEIFVEENCFNILISNNLGGVLELDKFGSMGYTTNGDGHGYGLALAQEILKNNKKIKVRTVLSGSVLTKVITLKI